MRIHLVKEVFKIDAQGQKCHNGYLAKNSHFAILALLSLCIDFKTFFGQMSSGWVLWKTYYRFLLKKYLRSCPGPSMSLSRRIDWIILSFPHRISKILFVVGSWDGFGSQGCGIGESPFFHVSILSLGRVLLVWLDLQGFQLIDSKLKHLYWFFWHFPSYMFICSPCLFSSMEFPHFLETKLSIWQKIATLPFRHFCPCASI